MEAVQSSLSGVLLSPYELCEVKLERMEELLFAGKRSTEINQERSGTLGDDSVIEKTS